MNPYLVSDYFWPNYQLYNISTILPEIVNNQLELLTKSTSIDMLASSTGIVLSSTICVNPAYPRKILYHELTTIRNAIIGLRQLDTDKVATLSTPYCWVDFNRSWELAHTEARQIRCLNNDLTNAAVYLEAVLRNVHFNEWLEIFQNRFQAHIASPILESSLGSIWLNYLIEHEWSTVDEEIQYWTLYNMMTFTLQYTNRIQIGIQEAISVRNALGSAFTMELKSIGMTTRVPLWTSTYMYMGLANDFDALRTNQSLVRHTKNYFGNENPFQIEAFDVGYPLSPLFLVVHNDIGPLSSIDLKWIQPLNELVQLVRSFREFVFNTLHDNTTIATAFNSIQDIKFTPTPLKWQNSSLSFHGGNHMCGFGENLTFVQESFGFDDACSSQSSFTVGMSKLNGLFARVMTSDSSPCSLEIAERRFNCHLQYSAINTLYRYMPTLTFTNSLQETKALDLSIMQFVADTQGIRIEKQALLDESFSFFGYLMLYDWVLNKREAISFQGDVQTINLISYAYPCLDTFHKTSQPLTWASYIRIGVYICSFTLCGVGAMSITLYLWHRRINRCSWFLFNRIVSTTWINQGVLSLRTLVAIICLATTSLTPQTTLYGFTQMADAPRTWIASCILAGETTWITYVVHAIFQPLSKKYASRYASLSSALSWFIVANMDIWAPPKLYTTLERSCSNVNMEDMIYCSSGEITLGSLKRTILIVIINIMIPTIAFLIIYSKSTQKQENKSIVHSLLLPPILLCYTDTLTIQSRQTVLDLATASMSGILAFQINNRQFIFDTKLWLPFRNNQYSVSFKTGAIYLPHCFQKHHRGTVHRQPSVLSLQRRQNPHLSSFVLCIGLIYLVFSLLGNVLYLDVVSTSLANDYGWANFNSTGTRTFLANLFNRELLIANSSDLELDSAALGDLSQPYNGTAGTIVWSETLARRRLFDPNVPLTEIIQGLRAMDPCQLPWMFTQYCWLDFNRTYDMASTATRQLRCELETSNGAMYLESALRNINSWDAWQSCWGESFNVGISREILTSIEGKIWLDQVQNNTNSIIQEMSLWKSHSISRFLLQWQNFKTTGLSDSMKIITALGWSFPLSLSSSLGTTHLAQQTSLKMYWTFASDLWAVVSNSTSINGMSLIASSSQFAFKNESSESLLYQNYTLASPLTSGFAVLRNTLGPFNAVDMHYISCPTNLLNYYGTLVKLLTNLTLTNFDAQSEYLILPIAPSMGGIPTHLLAYPNLKTFGGNLLCGDDQPTYSLDYGLDCFFGIRNMCHASFFDTLKPSTLQLFFVILAYSANYNRVDFNDVCVIDVHKGPKCASSYSAVLNFFSKYNLTMDIDIPAISDTIKALGIEIVQYLRKDQSLPLEIYRHPLIAMDDIAWNFYGWCYLYDWASGAREVVSFQGDASTITTISSRSSPLTMAPIPGEIPETLSFLFQCCVKYITVLFIFLAAVLVLSGISQRGHIEGLNLLELNRIVGHVWVGRALLVIRSITAIWLLNTSTLQLTQYGWGTHFVSPPLSWYKTILAGAESTWFVYVLNDVLSCLTGQYTTYYAFKSSLLAWAIVAIWTTLSPQTYQAKVSRTCSYVAMDQQLVCTSGYVEIGDVNRVGIGFLVATSSVLGCFIVERLFRRNLPPLLLPTEMLNASSYYMLDFSDWIIRDEYYLDKTSAIMAGILAVKVRDRLCMLDIKSWRFFSIPINVCNFQNDERIRLALPLNRL
ncbi:hypothetical protein THRCLA_02206 [Thraustotheca clavata]|uniref:Uncharacterized protein n=1 Tax=Thraustotheca clavata TaxID=74557 RepID=A0A1W0A606_9STRA|nr:hypothetical protein THRCLA_02206 [Thraustotheca clavata]